MDVNAVTWMVVLNAVSVWAINQAKASKLPIFAWVDESTPKVNHWLSIATAGLVTLGLTWSNTWDATSGDLTIHIAGLTAANVLLHGKNWVFNYAIQKTGYKMTSTYSVPSSDKEPKS